MRARQDKNKYLFIVLGLIFLGLFTRLSFVKADSAAKLYFIPSSDSIEVGKTFSVRLAVETGGAAINLIQGDLSFSNKTLTIDSISKTGTIIKLWFNEPSFSNSSGAISFSGGIPNPGFTGTGRVLIINFKTKATGPAWIKIGSAQVLANDGIGTNILSSTGQASFNLYETGLPKPTTIKPEPKTAVAQLKIFSSTHPDQQKWYSNKTTILSWTWNPGITDYNFILDQNPKNTPDNSSKGLNNSVSYDNLKDGTWYFHLRAKTSAGWSSPVHLRIQIDSQAPNSLQINLPLHKETHQTKPEITFSAQDELSGIDHYEIKVDDSGFIQTKESKIQIPKQEIGPHKITVRAYDQAGNFSEKSDSLTIVPISAPVITRWTKKILFAEYMHTVIIAGTAIPMSDVEVSMVHDRGRLIKQKIIADDQGGWAMVYRELIPAGQYQAYAITSYDGQVSRPSAKISFAVVKAGVEIFGCVIPEEVVLNIIIFLLCLLEILIVFILFLQRKFRRLDIVARKIITRRTEGRKVKIEEK